MLIRSRMRQRHVDRKGVAGAYRANAGQRIGNVVAVAGEACEAQELTTDTAERRQQRRLAVPPANRRVDVALREAAAAPDGVEPWCDQMSGEGGNVFATISARRLEQNHIVAPSSLSAAASEPPAASVVVANGNERPNSGSSGVLP